MTGEESILEIVQQESGMSPIRQNNGSVAKIFEAKDESHQTRTVRIAFRQADYRRCICTRVETHARVSAA